MPKKKQKKNKSENPYSDKEMKILLARAKRELPKFIRAQYKSGKITKELYEKAAKAVVENLTDWATDKYIFKISPNTRWGILEAIEKERWSDLIEAFIGNMAFGTAGIRGRAVLMAFDEDEKKKDPKKRAMDELDRFAEQGVVLKEKRESKPKNVNTAVNSSEKRQP